MTVIRFARWLLPPSLRPGWGVAGARAVGRVAAGARCRRGHASFPAAAFFTESKDSTGPSFGNYDLGGSVAVNFNRYVGVEGEVGGAIGVSQTLDFSGATLDDTKSPHLLNYSGNVIVHAARGSVVPYVTGGVGAQTLFERRRSASPTTIRS